MVQVTAVTAQSMDQPRNVEPDAPSSSVEAPGRGASSKPVPDPSFISDLVAAAAADAESDPTGIEVEFGSVDRQPMVSEASRTIPQAQAYVPEVSQQQWRGYGQAQPRVYSPSNDSASSYESTYDPSTAHHAKGWYQPRIRSGENPRPTARTSVNPALRYVPDPKTSLSSDDGENR